MKIKEREIGPGNPCYIIAEMSANHAGEKNKALEIVREAKKAGADCVKIQTYTADTITIDCDNPEFMVHGGLWDGYKLYDLYKDAYTPWDWQVDIKKECERVGIDFFSTPFDRTAVDFLETIGIEFYKIASYELNDIDLIEYVASKHKPMIMSCGMATYDEIREALDSCYRMGNYNVALLKCTSEYPANKEDMNLSLMSRMSSEFDVITGLSDHTAGSQVAELAVAMGAHIIEKHVIMQRSDGGPDAGFSMEMSEFADMVRRIRETEVIIGKGDYELSDEEFKARGSRRSLYVVKDMKKGDLFTRENVKSIRPAMGIDTKHIGEFLGNKAIRDIKFGEPLNWDMVK